MAENLGERLLRARGESRFFAGRETALNRTVYRVGSGVEKWPEL